ncbi:MAG: glycosyltransferase [Candidatus Abyssobacteria bacterium SURF_17]|uniref:Glycosyltransferase n=1 Tax=Candidatus Abyssobacteria bacterium SURF_17 TaxID=2093361 RepID=A0A419EQJ8_9BACT|nr:MAG: glycosyltransferase [Candidatus Abyssubacteria bacterium SURF_17]
MTNSEAGSAQAAREQPQSKSMPKISVIIPLHTCSARFLKDFAHFRSLEYPDFEILIVADEPTLSEAANPRYPELKRLEKSGLVTLLSTGKQLTGPAEKRDIGIQKAAGDICAFIDDDAYPRPDWLRSAVGFFDDPRVAAVGGPGVTPPEDNLFEQASGAVFASPLGSGHTLHRFVQRRPREVDDFPAFNLLVRSEVLSEVNGFSSTYYGGEDTKLCLEIVKLGKKILYRPEVVVFHHRRPLFRPHVKQIANVGVHRGYFAKTYPETSRRLFYFLPSLVVLALFFGVILSFFSKLIAALLLIGLGSYFAVAFVSIMPASRLSVALLGAVGIMASHIVYGCAFIRGLTLKHMDR